MRVLTTLGEPDRAAVAEAAGALGIPVEALEHATESPARGPVIVVRAADQLAGIPDGAIEVVLGSASPGGDAPALAARTIAELPLVLRCAVEMARERALRRAADAARAAAEHRLAQVSAAPADGIAVHDGHRVLSANRRMLEMFGYSEEEMLRIGPAELNAPEYRDALAARIAAGIQEPFATVGVRRDGSTFPCDVVARNVETEGGATLRMVWIRDASWRRDADEVRNATDRAVLNLADSLPDGVVVAQDVRIVYVNRAFCELVGLPADQLIGRSPYDMVHPEDRPAIQARGRATLTGDGSPAPPREMRMVRSDGGMVQVESAGMRIELGGRPAVVAVFRDVGERRRREQQRIAADRLIAMGTLAAGVAHEINNPLAAVQLNLDLVERELARPGGHGARERLDDARHALARTVALVKELRQFSRDSEERVPVDLRVVVDSALRLAVGELRQGVRVVREDGAAPPVLASEARLAQVLLDLIVNAIHAVAGRPGPEIRVQTGCGADGKALLEVEDNGVGMTPEVIARIFDPFFTTKPVGLGTGLGLSICYRLIADLGGAIQVDSQPGEGSRFRITLPPAAEPVQPVGAAARSQHRPRRARVLVVDDEPLIAQAVAGLLEPEHSVVTTTTAADALIRLRAGARYDVILCDLMMPGMSGMDLHRILGDEIPDQAARVVMMTGAVTTAAERFLAACGCVRLDKPFDSEGLLAALAAVLD